MSQSVTVMRRALGFVHRAHQQGVVLFVALIVLVAMTLAGLALIRSVDTNTLVAGNLAFKQGSTLAADRGVEAAVNWLRSQTSTALAADIAASWYFASMGGTIDFTGSNSSVTDYDWDNSVNVGVDSAGNTVRYVLHRMCDAVGDIASVNCYRVTTSGGSTSTSTRGVTSTGQMPLTSSGSVYYRVTVRSVGPKGTTSYVQSFIN